ncbi:MAG: NAD(P)H-dependent oxidoreductase subunit E [Bacilli bacterium]|nr:NAD(P)H-dependent oxidoreductase subunit E [Bacilli bacterium]
MANNFVVSDEQINELKEKIAEHKKKPGPLMPTLHDAQRIFGCIPIPVQKIISEELNESVSKINGVVTFYSHFSIEPKGKHLINVCMGTACYVRGSQEIIEALTNMLKIKPGETTEDGNFTLAAARCIGACGLAPVIMIDGKVYGSATAKKVRKEIENIIKDVKTKQ